MASFKKDRRDKSHQDLITELDKTLDTLNGAINLVQSKIHEIKAVSTTEEGTSQ